MRCLSFSSTRFIRNGALRPIAAGGSLHIIGGHGPGIDADHSFAWLRALTSSHSSTSSRTPAKPLTFEFVRDRSYPTVI